MINIISKRCGALCFGAMRFFIYFLMSWCNELKYSLWHIIKYKIMLYIEVVYHFQIKSKINTS